MIWWKNNNEDTATESREVLQRLVWWGVQTYLSALWVGTLCTVRFHTVVLARSSLTIPESLVIICGNLVFLKWISHLISIGEDCIVVTNYFLFHTGPTFSWNTGPPSDHTTHNGYYMYIETSWPRKYGDKAWMVSRNFQRISPGSEPCKLRFFYHMYGDSAEKLNVYIRTYRNGSSMQRVWSQVGSQGAIWNRAVVQLSSNKDFQVWLILFYPSIIHRVLFVWL